MTVKKRSQKQEKSVARDFNARPTVASGALWGMKGDVRNDKFLIECKTTQKNYYSLTAKVWEKIEQEALKDHDRIPLMVIDLEDSHRVIVFKPCYFNNAPRSAICVTDKALKSYRVKSIDLGHFNELGEYLSAISFKICGRSSHVLYCMKIEDFTECFKEEL